MKKILLTSLITFFATVYSLGQDTTLTTFRVGDSSILVSKSCYSTCEKKVLFLNIHSNESTSVEAATQYITETGGTIVTIENFNKRNISFGLKGKTYQFDPNRIYSITGAEATIKLLNKKANLAAAKTASIFGNQLVSRFVDSNNLVIALHNNTEGGLSVLSYQKDQELKKHVGKTYVSPFADPDDFILTTDSTIFERIKNKDINVVYENAENISDDGSLSIYCGRRNITYLNIEAQHEHYIEQLTMLLAIDEIIKEFSETPVLRDTASK